MSKKYEELAMWNDQSNSIEVYVVGKLDGGDYGVGQIEEIYTQTNNNTKFLGKLCSLLHSKGLLTLNEIKELV
jgi:hypothetical protein